MPMLDQQSDVARQFALGDPEAFETLFRQYQSEVYRWTVRIVHDPAAAEDLTIETFWRLYRAHARFDPERSFGAWARRIATNAALDHLKTRRREAAFPAEYPSAASPDPGVQHELQQRIRKAFQQLPAKLQVTATLALVEELPYKEISDALGISVGAVKLRVFRALRQLRRTLKHLGVEP